MKKVLIFSLLIISSKISHAQLDSMKFVPAKDNTIYSEVPSNSNALGFFLFAGRTEGRNNTENRRALLKFDFTNLPANAQVQSVRLNIAVTGAASFTTATYNFALHKVLKDWGEGTSASSPGGKGTAATTNDATWIYSLFSSSTWITPGGDFTPMASATSSVTFLTFPLNYGTWNSIGMKNDVIAWKSNPSNNFGWIILGEETVLGSAFKFASKDGNLYDKPLLTVFYTLPATDKVIINEVNPQKKWIELYNPSRPVVNLNNYYLANGASTQSLNNMTVLNGNLTLDSAQYVVINWTGIGQTDGELALFNGNPATAEMKDYVQYGSANHTRASAAVTAQVWDNANNFLPTISADTLTYSLNGNNIYTSGKATNSTSFVTQRQTPTYRNLLCPPTITLTGNVLDARYSSSGLVSMAGNISSTSTVKSSSQSYIQLNVNTLINSGAKFTTQIGACPNN
jgi:Lamin Tail Domain